MTGYSKEEVKRDPIFPLYALFLQLMRWEQRVHLYQYDLTEERFPWVAKGDILLSAITQQAGERKRLLVRVSFSILRFLFVSLEHCGKAVSLWIARVERCGNWSCVRWDTSVSELAGKSWQQSPKFKNSPEWQWLPATLKKEDTALNCLRPEKTIVIP